MVLCFNADAGAKIALDNLLSTGLYKDTSEAICVSLINHDIIQREAQHNGCVEIKRADLLDDSSSFVHGTRSAGGPSTDKRPNGTASIPSMFRLPHTGMAPDEFPLVVDVGRDLPSTSPRHWLFGQYNKLLPVKATLRGLLHLMGNDRHGVVIPDAVRSITAEALALGEYLEQRDRELSLSRENALSTAFPTKSAGAAGQSRFGNQFVAAINAEGTASGLPIALRLTRISDGKPSRLNLTRPGLQFALLENPVLDHGSHAADEKLSDAETTFLVSHITKYVPEERAAFTVVLGALSDGLKTPKQLDDFIFTESRDDTMTSAFTSLQRSGVISRLIDLQLVRRLREGTRVTYQVTESGDQLVAELRHT